MRDLAHTLLEAVNHLLHHHPGLAGTVEQLAAQAQGKGWGTATIEHEVACMHQLLGREPQLAVDVGGNVGDYAAALRARNPTLELHVFEPSPTNQAKLRARYADDPHLTLVPLALSDRAGAATLHADVAGSGMGSLSHRDLAHRDLAFDVREAIETIRFEDYWTRQLGRRPLDLVKIDIEGHELAALRGFGEALAATQVLQFEFGGCNIDTRTYWKDFWQLFSRAGFELYRIAPHGVQKVERYLETDEHFSTTNFIAVRRG